MRLYYFLIFILIILKTCFSQESLVFDQYLSDPNTYSYNKTTKDIYYRDLFDGNIYYAKMNSSSRTFFLGDSFITPPIFFNDNQKAAILKSNNAPIREFFYYDFVDSSLIFKAYLPSSTYNLNISPNDEKILITDIEPNYYSIINDTLIDNLSKFYPTDVSWDSDSSFYFRQGGKYIFRYNYLSLKIDTLLEAPGYDEFTSILFDQGRQLLVYGYSYFSGNLQLILYDLNTGHKTVAFDLEQDMPAAAGMAVSIKELKLSPLKDKIAFIFHYWTISAGDLIVYDYSKEESIVCTNFNYGVKSNLMWINQDTVFYYKEFQLYSFDVKNYLTIPQESYPISHDLQISNYPNPFNSHTLIEIKGIDLGQNTCINIFNIIGKKVRTLDLPNRINPNKVSVVWDGLNDNGVRVSTGIYIATLSGNDLKNIPTNLCNKIVVMN